MPTYTTHLHLMKPDQDQGSWGDAVNGNFDTLDGAINTLQNGGVQGPQEFGEVPAGISAGTTTLVLTVTPTLLFLYRGGLFQTPGADYTITGTTITLVLPVSAGEAFYAQGFY